MELNSKIKKRFWTFLLFPVFSLLTLLTDDITIRIIASCIIIVLAGVVIFFRESLKDEDETDEIMPEPLVEPVITRPTIKRNSELKTDIGEGIVIVKKKGESSVDEEVSDLSKESVQEETLSEESTKVSDKIVVLDDKKFFKPRDFKKRYEDIALQDMPRSISDDEQFGFVLEIILQIIKEIFGAHTALFYWYNKSKGRLTLEKHVSECSDINTQKIPVVEDIVGKIIINEEPDVYQNIPTKVESDNLPYYTKPQSIKSFVGVPLFFEKKITGLLAMDSTQSYAYGIEHIYSLGRFVRIISILIALFDEKSSETQAEKRLESLLGVINSDLKFRTEFELADLLEHSARNIVDWDAISIIYFYPNDKKFKAIKVVNKTTLNYLDEGSVIELESTVIGKAIKNRTPIKIDDVAKAGNPRYNKAESIQFEGSFLAIPLSFEDETYGVVCFENMKKFYYSNTDVKILKHALKLYAFVVYSYSTQAMYKDLLTVDPDTQALNKAEFMIRVKQMMTFAKEKEINSALVLLNIDEFAEENTLFEGNIYPKVMKTIVELIKTEINHNFIFGRLSNRVFGLFLLNHTTNDAFTWAERIRLKVARKPLTFLPNQTMFTISLGVAGANNEKSLESVLDDAELALKKAIEKGGNITRAV